MCMVIFLYWFVDKLIYEKNEKKKKIKDSRLKILNYKFAFCISFETNNPYYLKAQFL